MRKPKLLHLPDSVTSVFFKKMGVVKVSLAEKLPDGGWDALKEIAEANGMTVSEICSEREPFISGDFCELKTEHVCLEDVDETAEKCW